MNEEELAERELILSREAEPPRPITMAEAASFIEDLMHAAWRLRVGRRYPEIIEEVTGVSFTWSEVDESNWRFLFSIRRKNEWKPVEMLFDHSPKEDEEIEGESMFDDLRELSFSFLNVMMQKVFPDVKDD